MSDTLRDQLLGLGFKPASKAGKHGPQGTLRDARRPLPPGKTTRSDKGRRPGPQNDARPQADIELAKAYAIRAQREKQERIEAEQRKQEDARVRREARTRLVALLEGKALNDPDAVITRHFEYGGKIKRIHVNVEQLAALNAGALGVLQLNGRYLLVTAELLTAAEAIFAPAVALKVDPAAAAGDDPYADPQYQVPDDLVW